MIIEEVIERESEEAPLIANVSAIEKRIEEQNRVVNPFQKSRVVKTKFEERKIKRERQQNKKDRTEKKRVVK